MIPGQFIDLYAAARLREREQCCVRSQPVRLHHRSPWKWRIAQSLVRLAVGIGETKCASIVRPHIALVRAIYTLSKRRHPGATRCSLLQMTV